MEKKLYTSMRLSPEAKLLLVKLARALQISQTAVLELAIREKARKERVERGNIPSIKEAL